MLPDGQRHLISTITFGGQLYSLYVMPDSSVSSYYINLVVGPYDASAPSAICSVVLTDIDKRKTPTEAITKVITAMNVKMTEYFGSGPVPTTWEEMFEEMVQGLVIFLQNGIPQIK